MAAALDARVIRVQKGTNEDDTNASSFDVVSFERHTAATFRRRRRNSDRPIVSSNIF